MSEIALNQGGAQDVERIDLGSGWLDYYRNVFEPQMADALFTVLRDDIAWRQDVIKMMGKQIPIPRMQAWHGDRGASYRYSGLSMRPTPWTTELSVIRERVRTMTDHPFNSVLLNLYRTGRDSMGWHSDDEPELGNLPVIAAVSLGQPRRFVMRHKQDKTRRFDRALEHNSLLLMSGEVQQCWQHAIPKTRRQVNERISLTFRNIVT